MPVTPPGPTTRWRCTLCGNLTRFDVTRSTKAVEYVHVDLAGRSLCTPGLQLLQRITGELVCLGPAGGVVVGCHESHFCGSEWGARGPVTD